MGERDVMRLGISFAYACDALVHVVPCAHDAYKCAARLHCVYGS
jgi:hypothetical protein